MSEAAGKPFAKPVVFLGPSMAVEDARDILDAEYRPPIQRGDLGTMPAGMLVGVIDGIFQHSAAVSPREIHRAVERGVRILGSSSMGALRALEIEGMTGVGHIFEMYRDGLIISDDEVALAFDPESHRAVTVPLVNIRFAVGQLVRSGTLNQDLGDMIVEAAIRLHFTERTYPVIMKEAGLMGRSDIRDLCNMLEQIDLKREDAFTLLEKLANIVAEGWSAPAEAAPVAEEPDYGTRDNFAEIRSAATLPADAPVLIWETGDRVEFSDLILFLKLTGVFPEYARNALARFAMEGNEFEDVELDEDAAQALFSVIRRNWGWMTGVEGHVTTRDLGLGMDDLGERCGEEMTARMVLKAVGLQDSPEFLRALRAELFMNDLALKRETMRLGSFERLAAEGRESGPATDAEIQEARFRLAAVNRKHWSWLQDRYEYYEIDPDDVSAFVERLALARRVGHEFRRNLAASRRSPSKPPPAQPLGLKSSPKADGDLRYCMPMDAALKATERLQEVIGITRVGMIGELGARGIQISQAARPSGKWSSTYGSGKGETQAGAIVGGIMEELEKWAQEQFQPPKDQWVMASYRSLGDRAVDPRTLALPYDSCYQPDLVIPWYPCWDLLSEREMLVPFNILTLLRLPNDIYYSPRGCRRFIETNGLASGFTLEETLVHAIGEYVERHATRLYGIRTDGPGMKVMSEVGGTFLDPSTYPPSLDELVQSVKGDSRRELMLEDITCEIGIPIIYARLYHDDEAGELSVSFGWGAHPNPEVAAKMAVFEAVQTWISTIAGGREDLTINARSLGRHERPRTFRVSVYAQCQDPDRRLVDTRDIGGLVSNDAYEELTWMLHRLRASGVQHVLTLDLSRPEIAPARVCRVVIPGLDTTNPYHIGKRSRMALIRDLLPRLD